jgi:outer membrane protein OmpA-like peptidoglycan-associated protein
VLAVLGCLGLALAYFLVIRDQGEVSTVASDGGSPPAETTDATSVTGITIGQSPTSQEQSAAVQSSEAEPSGAGLTGTMVGEQIVVEGEVPTTQASAGLLLLLEQVVGVGNVDIADLAVNPDAATPDRIALVVANEVVFPPSSAEIEGEFLATLDNVADMMTINPDLTAVVEGHADSVGARSVNLSLSQRRADAVVDYLVGNGVERVRLIGMGRGSDEPIADNSTPEGREQNRRIEFIIVGFRLNL